MKKVYTIRLLDDVEIKGKPMKAGIYTMKLNKKEAKQFLQEISDGLENLRNPKTKLK